MALMLTFPAIAQERLPEYGDISDIKDMQKVYLTADSTNSRNLILKELKKYSSLSVVNSPDEAEFILEYKTLSRESNSTGPIVQPGTFTSEMTAYTLISTLSISDL